MRRNGYLWTSGVNLDTAVRFTDPDFLLECKILAIFGDVFCWFLHFYMLNVRHISTSGLFVTTERESIPHASTPTSIIPTRFEVDMTIHCRVIVFLSADTPRDLMTLTFDLLTLNICHTWRVTWPTLPSSMKTLRSWVMSYNISRWLPLKMRTRLLRMRRITWPMSRGQKQLHFWYAGPRFDYSLCNFGGSTMKVIIVICENNARPCVKRRMSFGACAKSRDLLKVR